VADEATFTDEESADERAFDYDRTVALSDGVFAIALTLLVLSLTVPNLRHGHTGVLGSKLLHRNDEYISYGISFAVISLLWVRHHRLFRAISRIDGRVTALNLAYLAFVAFLPFPARVLGVYGDEPAAIVLYATTVVILSVLGGSIRIHVRRVGLIDPSRTRELASETWLMAPAVFLASIPIAFVNTTLAKCFWLVLLIPAVVPRLRGRARRRNK
jgi:uncharacterized membrane protein